MKLIFNKIYYAYSKTERWINQTKRKGDFSWGIIIDVIVGFELGISFAIASIPTFLFVRNYFDYIVVIPFSIAGCVFFLIHGFVKKQEWECPDKSLWPQFDKTIIIPEWIAIGVVTFICSLFCVLGGGLLFGLSLFHIYD